jgi:hypothetical protein
MLNSNIFHDRENDRYINFDNVECIEFSTEDGLNMATIHLVSGGAFTYTGGHVHEIRSRWRDYAER